jgi:hypothetical protein
MLSLKQLYVYHGEKKSHYISPQGIEISMEKKGKNMHH